jgi:hypothetical protein
VPDDVLHRFAELNPVPDPDRLALRGEMVLPADPVLRAVLEQARASDGRRPRPPHVYEETTMSTFSPPRQQQDPPARDGPARRWLLAAGMAAAAVAVGVVVGVSTLGSEEGPAVAADEEGAVVAEVEEGADGAQVDADTAIAQAYIEARNAYDVDQARELVSEDFATTEVPEAFRDLATMELAFATHEAYGFQYSEGACLAPTAGPEESVFVHCDYAWTSELQTITGYPPVPVQFTFQIEDGRISRIAHDWNRAEFAPNVYDPWLTFLTEEHPEFATLARAIHRLDPDRTVQAVQQMPEHLELYEEWVRTHDG